MLFTLLVVLLVVVLVSALPGVPWAYHQRGYYPVSVIGVIVIVLVLVLLLGRY